MADAKHAQMGTWGEKRLKIVDRPQTFNADNVSFFLQKREKRRKRLFYVMNI